MSIDVDTVLDRQGQPIPLAELRDAWPLSGWHEVVPVHGGKNEHFRISAGDGAFYLRRSYRSKSVADLVRQTALMTLLARRGLPVPLVVPTSGGDRHVAVDGRLWVVTTALSGTPYDPARPSHLQELGRTLARYHQTVTDLDAGSGEPAPLVELRLRAAQGPVDPFLHQRAAEVIEELGRVAPELPRAVIHGGARRGSVLFDGDRLSGVLDFDSAVPDARVLDLAVAVHDLGKVYTSLGAEDHKVALDLDRVEALLEAYVEQSDGLTSAEAVALPLLLQSKRLKRAFGRLARLETGELLTPNDHAKIGLERSRVRWLHEHRDELAQLCAAASRPPDVTGPHRT